MKEKSNIEVTEKKTKAKKKPAKKEIPVEVIKYDIEGKFIHICVGDNESPASDDDINKVEENIKEVIPEDVNCIIFVTHHAIKVSVL